MKVSDNTISTSYTILFLYIRVYMWIDMICAGHNGLAVTCLTVLYEVLGLNSTVGSCVSIVIATVLVTGCTAILYCSA